MTITRPISRAAFAIVRALGALDVGQAAVVCEGLALAVEAAEGTDAMIARIASLRESLRGTPEKKRGVLVKALEADPGRQDRHAGGGRRDGAQCRRRRSWPASRWKPASR